MNRLIATLAGVLLASSLCSPILAQQQCSVIPVGQGCGPTLTGGFTAVGGHHQLWLRMENGFPQEHGMWIFGLADITFPIPDTSCFLYTTFLYGHGFMSDANGAATLQRSWVLHHIGSIRLQAASYRFGRSNTNIEVRTANAVVATCTN